MKRIAFSLVGLVVFGAIIGLSVSSGLAETAAAACETNAEKLTALRRERRDALQEAAKTAEKGYRAGVMDYESMKRTRIELLNAELDLAIDRPERVAVRERLVEQFRKFEKEVAEHVAVAQASSTDLLEAKAARLKAEIDLLLESAEAQPQLIGQEKTKDPSLAKREYKVLTELDSKSLNELGEQGWDLVTVVLWGPEGRHFYLRRLKP